LPGSKDEPEVDARVQVKEKVADVVEDKDPGREAIRPPLEAISELVDCCCLV